MSSIILKTQLEDYNLGHFVPKSVRRHEQLFNNIAPLFKNSKRNPVGNFNGTHLNKNIDEA